MLSVAVLESASPHHQRAGEPEVGEQHAAVAVDQDVLGVHVAVNDTVIVGGVQRRGKLDRVLQHGRAGKLSVPREPVAQAHPLDKLKRDPGNAVLLESLQDRNDVRVRDPRGGAALTQKAMAEILGGEERAGADASRRPRAGDPGREPGIRSPCPHARSRPGSRSDGRTGREPQSGCRFLVLCHRRYASQCWRGSYGT